MEIVEKIKFKNSSNMLVLTAMDYMYAGYPYRIHGINGVCMTDCTKNQTFNFQTVGVFTLNIKDSTLDGVENFKVGSILYYNTLPNHTKKLIIFINNNVHQPVNLEAFVPGKRNSDYVTPFGIIISEPHLISKRFDFMLIQNGGY